VEGRTASWSSSDSMVVSVDASGLVTARGIGTASVRATPTRERHAVTGAFGYSGRYIAHRLLDAGGRAARRSPAVLRRGHDRGRDP
jgi:hypothetical protein